MANFKERYLAGEIEFEEIDDYVDEGDDALYELLEQQREG